VNELEKLNVVKEELSWRPFGNVSATIMAEDIIILHEATKRARLPYQEACRIIRDAPDTKAMWAVLEARGLLWPHTRRLESGLEQNDA
jgi:hypothetical protein